MHEHICIIISDYKLALNSILKVGKGKGSSLHLPKADLTLSVTVAAVEALTVMETTARAIPTTATTNTWNKIARN